MADFTTSDRSPPPEAPIKWCHEVVQDVSRTFAITIDLLDEPTTHYICVGYLLCRVPDTIEDASHIPNDEKVRLLSLYDEALDPDADAGPDAFADAVEEWLPGDPDAPADWAVARHPGRLFAAYAALDAGVREAMRPPIRELVGGMTTFVERTDRETGLRIDTREELESYCYYVAGTVGHLITNLVAMDENGDTERFLRERAESFGMLLQLVNIAKDVHTDYHDEDNIYVPGEWLAVHGIPQEEILALEYRAGAGATVKRLIDHARSFRPEAREYLAELTDAGDRHLSAWGLPYLLAVATLRELDANLDDVFTETPVKVPREEVVSLIAAFTSGTPDQELIDELERKVERDDVAIGGAGRDADPA